MSRARNYNIPLDGKPGKNNAITDVPGVQVGYTTLTSGGAKTGVTAILPRGKNGVGRACTAATFSFNGNGELTGRSMIDEAGVLALPILITNSHSVGAVHRACDLWVAKHYPKVAAQWMLPVVGETWDGYLNEINGDHVKEEHVMSALDGASGGPLAEGNVGGGTGMNCYSFKGGSGTSSREVPFGSKTFTVGCLLQANFGRRNEFKVAGIPLGKNSKAPNLMGTTDWFEREAEGLPKVPEGSGSIIVVVATDAPMLPGQLQALCRRVPLGLARTGTCGGHFSGDIFVAFSTADSAQSIASRMPYGPAKDEDLQTIQFVPWGHIDMFYEAVVECVEEAVLNALVAAEDLEGRDGHKSFALPKEELEGAFGKRD
ncbi:Beta-peptidyl aminopeptidase BapA [Yarrowia sp. C11]|nr:Beta-peptidyl aminopeptidase BapA [Yarrowia sp. C11]KAG5364897.1 Beta-peptidyl aminopeptidase BapA [Yarrowia sp. E02]